MATLKQKKAAKLISESIKSDKPQTAKALLEQAGYAPSTANRSTQVMQSRTFREILEEQGVTDDKLSKVLDEGLGATRAVVMGVKSDESFVDIQPDFAVRHKYLETAIKVKGHIKTDDEPKGNIYNTQVNIADSKGQETIDAFTDFMLKKTKVSDE